LDPSSFEQALLPALFTWRDAFSRREKEWRRKGHAGAYEILEI
jgi:hypothetical protein